MKKLDKELLPKRNVIGFDEDKDKIYVFLEKKYDKSTAQRLISNPNVDFWEKDLVPKTIRRWFKKKEVEIIEEGEVKALVDAKVDRRAYTPLVGGCEIGIKGDRYVGTLGGLVYRRRYKGLDLYGVWDSFISFLDKWNLEYDEEEWVLSNAHVLLKDVFKSENFVYQQPLGGRKIGEENEVLALDETGDNYIDAGIFRPLEKLLPEQVPGWKIKGFASKVRSTDELKKYGRTTSATTGTLVSSHTTIYVSYNGGKALFKGVYRVTDMSLGGDSGSFVLNQDDEVVGLVFAGGEHYTYLIPIERVAKHFKLSGVYK